MDIIHERMAGLDVHKAMIVACVRACHGEWRMANGKAERTCQTYDTTTDGLKSLLAWLTEARCTHVAMEATGVYWKPVWNILSDGDFELLVANAAHIKNVPGRKTDVNDAMWISNLLACGLIGGSFVPCEAIQQLRALLRTRKQLVREQTSHTQRIQKTLEEANIKLDTVISEILGVSGRRMIEAMIAGVTNPRKLAELADRRIKATPKVLYDALHGRLTRHHRFLLQLYLGQYDAAAAAISSIDEEVGAAIETMDAERPAGTAGFRSLIALLLTITGRQHLVRDNHPGGNWQRHEPLSHRRASAGMGWPVLQPERERRQAKVLTSAKRRSMAQDHARPVRMGRQTEEGQLLQGTVQPVARKTRAEGGNLRRSRLAAHRDLSHAEGWYYPSGPWRQPL